MSSFNKPTTAADLAEFEALAGLTTADVKCTGARWERKKQALKASSVSNTPTKRSRPDSDASCTPSKASNDRFIPCRPAMDMASASASLFEQDNENKGAASEYQKMLDSGFGISDESREHRILSFRTKAPVAEDMSQRLDVLYSSNRNACDKPRAKATRQIPSLPSKILDAPDLLDDYYLNLLSWSSENIIAVALGPAVYLWNAKTGSIDELMSLEGENDYVSSVKWIPGGSHLAVGTASAQTQLWDATALKQVRSMNGHAERISSLSWNQHLLTSGSKDSTIVNHDVRVQQHHVATFQGHTQEVCGLEWSPDGTQLASGGNDNLLCIWDAAAASSSAGAAGSRPVVRPRFTCGEHQAAVKALAWSPHERHLVASGGGTADRCIKFTNTQTGALLNSIDTGSQVCALQWNPHEKEILSSHGFSKNELCLWKYPTMAKVKELTGHTARVLHMATGPTGQVVSAGADETLRFWDVFGEAPEAKKARSGLAGGGTFNSSMQIR